MSSDTISNDDLLLMAVTHVTSVIAIGTALIELFTHDWLAHALGLPVFVSTPLGIALPVLSVIALRSNWRLAVFPALATIAYWAIFYLGFSHV